MPFRDNDAEAANGLRGYRVLDSALTLTLIGGALVLSGIALHQGLEGTLWVAVVVALFG